MRPHPILPIKPNSAMPGRYLKVRVPPPFMDSIISGGYPCSRRRRAPASPEYRSATLICAFAMYAATGSQDTHRTDPAGVHVGRRADVSERRVIAVLVVIDALPGPVRILPERVAHLDDRLQRGQGQCLVRNRERYDGARARFHKLPSG